jgi:hypothetical protein
MALITGRGSFGGGQPLSESEYTLLLLKHGEAVLAESDPHHKHSGGSERASSTGSTGEAFGAGNESAPLPGSKVEWGDGAADAPTSARSPARLPVTDHERRHRLEEMAERLTGKRRSKDDENAG